MNINDHVTYIKNQEDAPFLRSKLFDVNMRLFKSHEVDHNLGILITDWEKP